MGRDLGNMFKSMESRAGGSVDSCRKERLGRTKHIETFTCGGII